MYGQDLPTTNIAQQFNHQMEIQDTLDRLPELKALVTTSTDYDTRKRDDLVVVGQGEATNNKRRVDPGIIRFDSDGRLKVGVNDDDARPLTITSHGWSQYCAKTGEALYGRVSSLHRATFEVGTTHKSPAVRDAVANLLNTLMDETPASVWMVRAFEDQARAFVSPSYAEVSNTDMLVTLTESLMGQIKQHRVDPSDVKLTRTSRVTPDDLHVQVITKGINPNDEQLPDQKLWEGTDRTPKGNPYGLGVRITNNETGRGGITVTPIIKRTSCDNSIAVWGATTNVRHRGSREGLLYQITTAMFGALKVSIEHLDRLMRVRSVEIPNVYNEIDVLAEKYGWSTDTTNQVRKGTEGKSTLYGLVNGISSVPAHSDSMAIDSVMTFEDLAGQLLVNPSSIFAPRQYAWVVGGQTVVAE